MALRVKNGKISNGFVTRLDTRDSKHFVSAILILKATGNIKSPGHHRTQTSRMLAIEQTRKQHSPRLTTLTTS